MGVRRADEVDVRHPVALDVVDEEALALDEPLVLLARDADPDEPLLGRLGLVVVGATVVSLTSPDPLLLPP